MNIKQLSLFFIISTASHSLLPLQSTEELKNAQTDSPLSQSESTNPNLQYALDQCLAFNPKRHDIETFVRRDNPNSLNSYIYYEGMKPQYITSLIKNLPGDLRNIFHDIKNYLPDVENKIILVGPSGCGKSDSAKAIAIYCRRDYLFLSAKSFGIILENSASLYTSRLLDYIKTFNEPFVIIIDDLQDIFGKNNDQAYFSNAISNIEMLIKIVSNNQNILLIFTADNLNNIPASFQKLLNEGVMATISLPNETQREAILQFYFKPLPNDLWDNDYTSLAMLTEGFSAREIAALKYPAIRSARSRVLDGNKQSGYIIKIDDIFHVLKGKILYEK